MLVPQELCKTLLHKMHTLYHTGPVNLDPQRQGIDEHAKGTVGSHSTLHAAKQHGSEYNTLMGRCACHHLRPGQMEQTGRAHAERPCLAAQQCR